MGRPIRILLQTTIETTPDDWSIARFDLLRAHLAGLPGVEVEARDRGAPQGETDPVIEGLPESDFDELWLFAVDTGGGLNEHECAAISEFRRRGGGLMVTRDHMDLGASVCSLGGVGRAHYFHSRNLDPDPEHNRRDDPETPDIDWPNYHSGSNGDFQEIRIEGAPHPAFADPEAEDGRLHFLPAHPHEGGIGAPAGDATARVIATGVSQSTGRPFNLAVAFERGSRGEGRAIAQSTFHHFCDYNWDPRRGAPSFVAEPPSDRILTDTRGRKAAHRYVENLARWLARD